MPVVVEVLMLSAAANQAVSLRLLPLADRRQASEAAVAEATMAEASMAEAAMAEAAMAEVEAAVAVCVPLA